MQLYTDDTCTRPGRNGQRDCLRVTGDPGRPSPANIEHDLLATATDVSNNTSAVLRRLGRPTSRTRRRRPVSVDSGPTGTTTDQTPTFTFSGSDAVGPVAFQCSIDTGTPSFRACSGPGDSDTPASPLADGSYTFRVQATRRSRQLVRGDPRVLGPDAEARPAAAGDDDHQGAEEDAEDPPEVQVHAPPIRRRPSSASSTSASSRRALPPSRRPSCARASTAAGQGGRRRRDRRHPGRQEVPDPPAGLRKSGRPDLNRGPHRPERCALPGCATPRERQG